MYTRKATLQPMVDAWARHLLEVNPRRLTVALLADNSIDWLAIDLACQQTRMDLIPIPTFYTGGQVRQLRTEHPSIGVLTTTDLADRIEPASSPMPPCPVKGWTWRAQDSSLEGDAGDGRKLTFTSGSTAAPKPIVLSADQQWQTAAALRSIRKGLRLERHLCMLPLPVLLENVAGAYACLLADGELIIPPTRAVGLIGSSKFDAARLWDMLMKTRANSIIVLPQMLTDLLSVARHAPPLKDLRLLAVGGARVPAETIREARDAGLPAYQGYGLSEACSVVSLNSPEADRLESVGRPLQHVRVRIAADGEIIVQPWAATGISDVPEIKTGDLGHLDADGFLYVDGRKKNLIITSFGRNVSPEWPESLLEREPTVAQCLVHGDNQASLKALLVPAHEQVSDRELEASVHQVNQQLPDYAQIASWQRMTQAFTPANGLATPNGRPRRAAILQTLIKETLS
jgi:long-chain acyl-CoA synthetase